MDTSLDFDFSAWLLSVLTGFIFLMITVSRGNHERPKIFRRVSRLLGRQQTASVPELRETFLSAGNLRSIMNGLPSWAQLEMAEHLILEGPPFAAIALDSVSRIAQVSSGDLRSGALRFLNSSSIPFVARVSLAQRLLASATDDETKITALQELSAMASEPAVRRTGLIDSVMYTVAERIADRSRKVQAFAVKCLETELREHLPEMDDGFAKRLSVLQGEPLLSLIRFIDRNSSFVPQASIRARLYDTCTPMH